MAMAADWSSLPSDLLNLVADNLFSTDDLDYASLRAVCHNWRVAMAGRLDPRFGPRSWVMIESHAAEAHDSCGVFLNVDTGHFVFKDLPKFQDYACVAKDNDGLLVLLGLRNTKKGYYALNPFTRARIPFPMMFPVYAPNGRMLVEGSWPNVVLYGFKDNQHGASVNLNCRLSTFSAKPDIDSFASVVSCQGRVYAMDTRGTIATLENQWRITTVIAGNLQQQAPWRPSFLINNSGDLLVVRLPAGGFHDIMQVFKVDLDNKLLRIIHTIGNRAIFLGHRSLSVYAGNLPTIKSNCIYYTGGMFESSKKPGIYMHCLEEDNGWELVEPIDSMPPPGPLSLMRTLMNYANDAGRTDLDYLDD